MSTSLVYFGSFVKLGQPYPNLIETKMLYCCELE
jgi:hypothetical protein